jgi:hypothetical protein
VAMMTKPIMQKACAIIAIINMAALKSPGTVLTKSFMLQECAKIAILTCTIKKREINCNPLMRKLRIYKIVRKNLSISIKKANIKNKIFKKKTLNSIDKITELSKSNPLIMSFFVFSGHLITKRNQFAIWAEDLFITSKKSVNQ